MTNVPGKRLSKEEVASANATLENASPQEVLMKWAQFQQEAAIQDGAGWPPITLEDIKNSYVDWLPSVNLNYEPTDNLVLRLAALRAEVAA